MAQRSALGPLQRASASVFQPKRSFQICFLDDQDQKGYEKTKSRRWLKWVPSRRLTYPNRIFQDVPVEAVPLDDQNHKGYPKPPPIRGIITRWGVYEAIGMFKWDESWGPYKWPTQPLHLGFLQQHHPLKRACVTPVTRYGRYGLRPLSPKERKTRRFHRVGKCEASLGSVKP